MYRQMEKLRYENASREYFQLTEVIYGERGVNTVD